MNENILQSRLSLLFNGGYDEDGNEILVTKLLNIDITVSNEQLKLTAEAN
ncbi:DUF1659 domain-containing protein [Anaerobacillus sp. HL2]|nr:DUF1659 domain-containing protein [Anaerobacillus sp. HL2]